MKRILSQSEGLAHHPGDFHWLEKNIPCQAACPASTDIPGYLAAISRDDYAEAYRINLRDNVFPAVLGRVCSRPCEPPCRHGWEGLGAPVAICSSKRAAADFTNQTDPVVLPPVFPTTGRRVAIVGAGVAGLAAARDLALWGHAVTVYERHARPGGMMIQGIPHFRLPRAVIEKEIRQVEAQGVRIVTGTEVGPSLPLSRLLADHDAVIVAAGTLKPTRPPIPGGTLQGVEHGLQFLFDVNEGARATIGRRVVIIGGGFTAIDCARTARRLGARHAGVYYRRSAREMYIMAEELDEMAEEGIPLVTHVNPIEIIGQDGRATAVRFVRTRVEGGSDKNAQKIVPIEGSEFEVPADNVILATGQSADRSWMDAALQDAASTPKLFAAGDFVNGPSTLIEAIGHARRCARSVDEFLMGESRLHDAVLIETGRDQERTRKMDHIPLQHPAVAWVLRRSLHREVEKGFSPAQAAKESKRCYLCHYKYEINMDLCIYCDQCIQVKPREKCIVKVMRKRGPTPTDTGEPDPYDHRLDNDHQFEYVINQEECIRCDACLRVCPTHCIDVQKVSLKTLPSKQAGTGSTV